MLVGHVWAILVRDGCYFALIALFFSVLIFNYFAFRSNPKQTHPKQVIEFFSIKNTEKAGELKQVGNKLFRTVGPQEQGF